MRSYVMLLAFVTASFGLPGNAAAQVSIRDSGAAYQQAIFDAYARDEARRAALTPEQRAAEDKFRAEQQAAQDKAIAEQEAKAYDAAAVKLLPSGYRVWTVVGNKHDGLKATKATPKAVWLEDRERKATKVDMNKLSKKDQQFVNYQVKRALQAKQSSTSRP